MRSRARSVHVVTCLTMLFSLIAGPVLAQTATESPAAASGAAEFSKPGEIADDKGGICAPWHRCIAWAGLGMAVLLGLALAAGYLVQSKGFDQVEHRQGNPEGIKVSRE